MRYRSWERTPTPTASTAIVATPRHIPHPKYVYRVNVRLQLPSAKTIQDCERLHDARLARTIQPSTWSATATAGAPARCASTTPWLTGDPIAIFGPLTDGHGLLGSPPCHAHIARFWHEADDKASDRTPTPNGGYLKSIWDKPWP